MSEQLAQPESRAHSFSLSGIIQGAAMQRLLAFGALILLLLGFSLASPNFFTVDNLIAILIATTVNGVLALGVTFVIITAGIDLSIGTVLTLSAVMTGVLHHQLALAGARSASWAGSPPGRSPAC